MWIAHEEIIRCLIPGKDVSALGNGTVGDLGPEEISLGAPQTSQAAPKPCHDRSQVFHQPKPSVT